ncbi:MAG: hypothetical protein E7452_11615 [Ruminococcaceae bacterium]|nr:hypothetical protein [Oscillospiraceae bacterium]
MSSGVALPNIGGEVASAHQNTVKQYTGPAFKLSGLFASHMVLQREKPIKIWGFSLQIGSEVTGSFMGETVKTTVGGDNRWELTFSPHLSTSTPQKMVIYDAFEHAVTLDDILIGDVWIIGGQSNAELNLVHCMPLTPDVTFDERDNFRLFYQNGWSAMMLGKEDSSRHTDIIDPNWTWNLPNEENSLSFSAVGWYFARELTKHIDVPLGLVMMAAGGVCLRELMPTELATPLGYTTGANTRIGGCFDTLVNPILPLAFKAQIFFQGESEGCWFSCANQYDTDLKAFFDDERARFGQNFPIYNVQLSEYGENCLKYFPALDIVRIKQFDALSLISDMTLTVDMDLGIVEGYDWAHSPRKRDLAQRLAKLALAKEYGIGDLADAVSPSPICASFTEDKKEIVIEFADVGTGLTVCGQDVEAGIGLKVNGFSLGSYENKRDVEATIISRNKVAVAVSEDADTSHVNYCFAVNVAPELYNGNKLPCPAFSLKVRP